MSKMAPKKYGNRQTLAGDPDAPLRIDVSKMTDLQLEAALKLFAMTSNATRVPARKAETN